MKNTIFSIITVIIVVFLGVIFSTLLRGIGCGFSLSLIVVVYLSLYKGSLIGETSGFIFGLSEDVFSYCAFGSTAFSYTIIGFLAGRISNRIDESYKLTQICIGAIAAFFNIIILFVLQKIFITPSFLINFKDIIINVFFNGLITPFVFIGMDFWMKLLFGDINVER